MTTRDSFAFMDGSAPERSFGALPSPCYVIVEAAMRRNCETLASVKRRAGCRILLAQKAFSNFALYPMMSRYLDGTEASGLFEARLGREEMPSREVHVFCAAYRDDEIDSVLRYVDHIVFNSPSQLARFGARAKASGASVGLRVDPERSTQEGHAIYDPCAPGSRLGTTRAAWDDEMTPELIELLDGLHFHTLCEQDSDDLETTLGAVADKFGEFLGGMRWLNMGGGHHITRPGYDIDRLVRIVTSARERWGVEVYLEPGEACALDAGVLVSHVLDIVRSGGVTTAILDASAACHMPDVIEMPYRPPLYGAGEEGARAQTVRLAGPTCLAGDVIGDYSFDRAPAIGDMMLFGDMAIYTTCKNNTFNGMPLPPIFLLREDGTFETLAEFGYEDFKSRLGSYPRSAS